MSWEPHYGKADSHDVEGGIKSNGPRGTPGNNWWTKGWINTLEDLFAGKRLIRGKRYARQGRVLSIDVDLGIVAAEVKGSRPEPYYATLEVPLIPEDKWRDITQLFSEEAVYAARLLAGRMPENIQDCFENVGTSLFPRERKDLTAHCACSDSHHLCKHLAAVCYLLGEQFDRDPFLMFKLRGMERSELLSEMNPEHDLRPESKPDTDEDIPTAPADFWKSFERDEVHLPGATIPKRPAQLPNRLGPFPFWRSDVNFLRKLEIIYENAAGRGLRVATSDND